MLAGSSKKESSGQSRSLWCEEIVPACLSYYEKCCVGDGLRGVRNMPGDSHVEDGTRVSASGRDSDLHSADTETQQSSEGNENEDDDENGEMEEIAGGGEKRTSDVIRIDDDHGKEQHEHRSGTRKKRGCVLIACEEGMLSCTVALCILLTHFNTSMDFGTHLPPLLPHSLALSLSLPPPPLLQSTEQSASPSLPSSLPLPLPLFPPPSLPSDNTLPILSTCVALHESKGDAEERAAAIEVGTAAFSVYPCPPQLIDSEEVVRIEVDVGRNEEKERINGQNRLRNERAMRLVRHVSKEDIKACLAVMQCHLPFADQLPRRFVKEVNMFFSLSRNNKNKKK